MPRTLRSTLGLGLALLACGAIAQAAAGDGLPVPHDGADNVGVAGPEGEFRYSAVGAGADTAVLRIAIGSGEIQRSAQLRGEFAIPVVAYDGTPSGLSADGETLVLIEPRRRFPSATTTFAVIRAEPLALRRRLTLRGDFSFDALSPDGRTMYLIRYGDPRDPTAYEVRAYDLGRGRLLPDPIVDPNESGEEMAGWAQTRAVSPDGRWAYTLYLPAEREHPPFIHALDTERGTAVCIDLDPLAERRNLVGLGLQPSPDGTGLAVVDGGEALARVDLGSFEVGEPAAPAPDAEGSGSDDSWVPWGLIAGGGGLLIVAAALIRARRRRDDAEEREPERLVTLERFAEGERQAREREPVR